MNDNVIDFQKAKKQRRKQQGQGSTLCKSGFHKWQIDQDQAFDVKQGKLLTVKRCLRCGKTKQEYK